MEEFEVKSKITKYLVVATVMVLIMAVASFVTGAGTNSEGPEYYIIQLSDAPVASYVGGVDGLAPTNPRALGTARLDVNSPATQAYDSYLNGVIDDFVASAEQALGRTVEVNFRYTMAYNGLSMWLEPAEADIVGSMAGVVHIQRNFNREITTDYGPAWLGAPAVWDGSAYSGAGTMGEGVVVGVIDTGQNLDHESFAEVGPVDGYVHTNPLGAGTFLGLCNSDPGSWTCNDKLIGYYIFTTETTEDTDGHGSHTASTSAGNVVTAQLDIAPTNPFLYAPRISGVAPHANIIGYDACDDAGGCPLTALTASINQTVADGVVDVINYSIGGGSSNPWTDADAQAFLGAADAGIIPVTSAGNSGPGPGTIGSPADAPWVLSVGASTQNRTAANALINMSGGDTAAPADMTGASLGVPYGPAPIVHASDAGDGQCLTPFPPGTWTNEIVVCDRGAIARVAKCDNVRAGGAPACVLANAGQGEAVVSDPHIIPAVHIGDTNGDALRAWLASGAGHTATIEGTMFDFSNSNADVMAGFSSRGPNPQAEVIKPDVTAPGVSILAAYRSGSGPAGDAAPWMDEYNFVSGTSMSSPHTAGAAALMRAVHPTWSVAQIKSAIMSTTDHSLMLKDDGVTPADPFDYGAGSVRVSNASDSGMVFDVTTAEYTAADPGAAGDPKTLNIPSFAHAGCTTVCSFTRTAEGTNAAAGTSWTATFVADTAGLAGTITPANITIGVGSPMSFDVDIDVTNGAAQQYNFGWVVWTHDGGTEPDVFMPVAVFADIPPTDATLSTFAADASSVTVYWVLLAGFATLLVAGAIYTKRNSVES